MMNMANVCDRISLHCVWEGINRIDENTIIGSLALLTPGLESRITVAVPPQMGAREQLSFTVQKMDEQSVYELREGRFRPKENQLQVIRLTIEKVRQLTLVILCFTPQVGQEKMFSKTQKTLPVIVPE